MKAEDYITETTEISGIRVRVNSYKIGDRFHCHVENTDPGATIAHAEAPTKEEAVQAALAKATERLSSA